MISGVTDDIWAYKNTGRKAFGVEQHCKILQPLLFCVSSRLCFFSDLRLWHAPSQAIPLGSTVANSVVQNKHPTTLAQHDLQGMHKGSFRAPSFFTVVGGVNLKARLWWNARIHPQGQDCKRPQPLVFYAICHCFWLISVGFVCWFPLRNIKCMQYSRRQEQ